MTIPGGYVDPATGMHIFPERPEETLAERVETLEEQVRRLTELVEALMKR